MPDALAADPDALAADPDALAFDVELYVDPACPFCWQTSKWLRQVARLRELSIGWRFISLQFVNEDRGYDEDVSDAFREVHRQGTRLLRVAAAIREQHGNDAVGTFYLQVGEARWEASPDGVEGFDDILERHAQPLDLGPVLTALGLDPALVDAADDERYDAVIRAETDRAFELAGDDVGTPIIQVAPPHGPGFFGPVISDLPSDDDAVGLWDAFERLARWEGFSELKRSLRQFPDVAIGASLR